MNQIYSCVYLYVDKEKQFHAFKKLQFWYKYTVIYIHVYEEKQFHALKNYNFGIIFSSSQGFLWEKNQN